MIQKTHFRNIPWTTKQENTVHACKTECTFIRKFTAKINKIKFETKIGFSQNGIPNI